MPVVLDTTFLVDLGRESEDAQRLLEELSGRREQLLVPTVVTAEYLGGSRDPEHDLARLQDATEILSFTVEDAVAAGWVGAETLAHGTFPGWTDCFIAGVARNRGNLAVVTANPRHFPLSQTVSY